MKRTKIYLDYAAATPLRAEVRRAMAPYEQADFANPGSITAAGVRARAAVEAARRRMADALGVHSDELIFTGSGTESANLALRGIMEATSNGDQGHLVTTAIEHEAVLAPARDLEQRGFGLTILPVDGDGRIALKDVQRAIMPQTRLVSVILANNEIGTIQDLRELSRQLRRLNKERQLRGEGRIYLHTDACQAAAYSDIRPDELGVDALTLNAAKIGGPKGIGLLYIRRGTPLRAQILGGGQEGGRRSGTEHVAAIIGFAEALALAVQERAEEAIRVEQLRDRLATNLTKALLDIQINGSREHRLANNLNITISGVEAEPLVLYLDEAGVAVGTGAACSTITLEPSHVLRAIGLTPERALQAIRITLGRETTSAEIERATKILIERITWLRKHMK